MEMEQGPNQSRRRFIKTLALGTAGLALTSGLTGCEPPEPEKLLGKVAEWKEKGELKGEFNGNSLLVWPDKEGNPIIFSLTCTHKQCTVAWKEKVEQFQCPCHEGKYDREGRVLSGPPPSPLRRYRAEIRGEDLWVINEYIS